MKKFYMIFVILIFTLTIFPDKKLVEEVEVDWWVVPLFAVDKNDNSVIDLKSEDLELFVNKKQVSAFTLYKREFSIYDRGTKEKDVNIEEKKKLVFLIFDIAYSTKGNLERSKAIAKDLVEKGGENSHFVIMIVDPFAGLQYKGGPVKDKGVLSKLIDRVVKMNPRARSIEPIITAISSAQISGGRGSKYSEGDMQFISEQLSTGLRNTNKNFFFSFESLYYSLNQITDNKFIYFFSEGLSFYSRKGVKHAEGEYFRYLKKSADFMGRSGSVIFMVDPTGVGGGDVTSQNSSSLSSLQSGIDSLKYLASESGGKYLRGNKEDLSEKLEKMNRAYYEIAFSTTGLLDGEKGGILIRGKRKGVSIHSLRTIEKRKKYINMKRIEKEVLVINILKRNAYFKPPVTIRGFEIISKNSEENITNLKVKLQGKFKGKYMDVFHIYFGHGKDPDISVAMEKKLVLGKDVNLRFKVKKDKNTKTVLISEKDNVAFVEGFIDIEDKFMKDLVKLDKKFNIQSKKMSTSRINELDGVLSGTAEYSTRLENAVFHFICNEEIHEVVRVLPRMISRMQLPKKTRQNWSPGSVVRWEVPGEISGSRTKKVTKNYKYDYQLIRNEGETKEQRRNIKKGEVSENEIRSGLKTESFISKKMALIPLAIFDILNQIKFKFRLIKYEKVKGVKTAVLEVFPKDLNAIDSIYGKVWIDINDHSIMRIVVNPVSIGGFKDMLKRSKFFGSILDVKCRIDFGIKRDGLRFPTSVKISERYHGGSFLKRFLGVVSWERSSVSYKYKDYRFFNVETEVKTAK